MRYLIILTGMFFASFAWADMRCSANSLGITICKDSDGLVVKSRTNSLGTTTYTDNKGIPTHSFPEQYSRQNSLFP